MRAVGTPQDVGAVAGAIPEVQVQSAVIPALVNAHAHLDLTGAGCRPYGGNFDAWLAEIRALRQAMTPDGVDLAVQQGVRALVGGGVAAVGDIAGQGAEAASLRHLRAAGMAGVSFAELFGLGTRREGALRAVERFRVAAPDGSPTFAGTASPAIPQHREAAGDGGRSFAPGSTPLEPAHRERWRDARQGLQPHAPYSSSRAVFLAALRSGHPVSTHLAESPEETTFVQAGAGRFRVLLEELGLWDSADFVPARDPVDWLADLLSQVPGTRILCAHCNEVDDTALAALASLPVTVAYCPRASAYFGRHGHRYREMLAHGVPVALGTDSMVCLDTPYRLSTLDEARWLLRHDGVALQTALAMATIHGARGLGLPAEPFTLRPDRTSKAGILLVPLPEAPSTAGEAVQAFATSASAPVWLAPPESFREVLPFAGVGRYSSGPP